MHVLECFKYMLLIGKFDLVDTKMEEKAALGVVTNMQASGWRVQTKEELEWTSEQVQTNAFPLPMNFCCLQSFSQDFKYDKQLTMWYHA